MHSLNLQAEGSSLRKNQHAFLRCFHTTTSSVCEIVSELFVVLLVVSGRAATAAATAAVVREPRAVRLKRGDCISAACTVQCAGRRSGRDRRRHRTTERPRQTETDSDRADRPRQTEARSGGQTGQIRTGRTRTVTGKDAIEAASCLNQIKIKFHSDGG